MVVFLASMCWIQLYQLSEDSTPVHESELDNGKQGKGEGEGGRGRKAKG